MTRSILALTPVLLLACDPKVEVDDTATVETDADTDTDADADADADSDTDADTDPTEPEWHLLVTTTDYTTGALARVDPDGTVTDDLLAISSDSAVRPGARDVYLLQRSSENTVSVFAAGAYTTPTLEFSTGDGSNPTAVANCSGKLWVTRFLTGDVGIYDGLSGLQTGSVDLSAWADADGSSEPDDIYVSSSGYLYVTLSQLDYLSTYSSADGSGVLVKIACADGTVAQSWDVGPNPRMTPDTSQPGRLILSGGDYYTDDFSGVDLDGGIWFFDTATDTLSEPLLTEASLGLNVGSVVTTSTGKALTSLDDGYTWDLACLDLGTGGYTSLELGNAFVTGMAAAPTGQVWVGIGTGFGTPTGSDVAPGLHAVDPATCAITDSATTGMQASSIGLVLQ